MKPNDMKWVGPHGTSGNGKGKGDGKGKEKMSFGYPYGKRKWDQEFRRVVVGAMMGGKGMMLAYFKGYDDGVRDERKGLGKGKGQDEGARAGQDEDGGQDEGARAGQGGSQGRSRANSLAKGVGWAR